MPRYDDDPYDDDDLDVRRPETRQPPNWFDQQFRNTNIILLILFAVCCGEIALIFGILGVALCTDRTAKTNATIVLAISAVRFCISMVGVAARIASQH